MLSEVKAFRTLPFLHLELILPSSLKINSFHLLVFVTASSESICFEILVTQSDCIFKRLLKVNLFSAAQVMFRLCASFNPSKGLTGLRLTGNTKRIKQTKTRPKGTILRDFLSDYLRQIPVLGKWQGSRLLTLKDRIIQLLIVFYFCVWWLNITAHIHKHLCNLP